MIRVDRSWLASLCGAAAVVSQIATAHAQSAEAEVLFRDGRGLIKRGKLATGCDKIEASARLEPSVGSLLNLGDCRDKLGRPASAWAAFRKAEAMARRAGGDDKRQAEAARRALQLESRLSNLVIEVPARVDGLIVRRDGEVVDPALWNSALPVDPGNYTILAEAPGYATWRTAVPIRLDTRRQVVVVPQLERAPVAAAPEPAAVWPPPAGVWPPSRTGEPPSPGGAIHSRWTATRKLSLGLALAGAGAAGTGIYFGIHARNLQDRADQLCPLAQCADPQALAWNEQARSSAKRANILYIAGGAAAATAVVLWLIGGPSETVVAPSIGDHRVALSMTGSF
jgi:hypothetical protein